MAHRDAGMVLAGAAMALTAALSLVACSSSCSKPSQPDAPDASAHASTRSLTPEQSAKVLARVGDRTITLGDYVATLEHMDQFDRLRYQSPERRKELLEEMINIELLAQEAKAKGYDKDPLTQQEERTILRDALLADARKGAPAPADIPEAEVRAYYEAHRADYRDPERRRVQVIVTKDEASATAALDAAKKATTAATWGEVVRARSIDPQAKAPGVPVDMAGDLGIVSPPGDPRGENTRVPEEVRAALFEIGKVGDVAPRTVKAAGRFYVVRLAQKTEARERTFPEAERTIRIKLAGDKLRAKEDELIASLRKQFPVQIDDGALGRVKVEPLDAGLRD